LPGDIATKNNVLLWGSGSSGREDYDDDDDDDDRILRVDEVNPALATFNANTRCASEKEVGDAHLILVNRSRGSSAGFFHMICDEHLGKLEGVRAHICVTNGKADCRLLISLHSKLKNRGQVL
jgi:hypothetical protein